MRKERLDIILVKRGFFMTREKARSSVMAGVVYVNKEKEDKPGTKISEDCEIDVKENINPYVSRGGLKLKKAIDLFNMDFKGKTIIDIGASTGGFTDCMLKHGAGKIFAVDVGYGQLAWELRNNEKVVCMERTNIRYVKPDDIGISADFATIDVSFISLKKVIPVVKNLLYNSGEIICLIKPQFEAGREKVGKHGVIKEPDVHREVITDIILFNLGLGMMVKGLTYSPIKGPEGNIEYLLYLSRKEGSVEMIELEKKIEQTVKEAHENL